MSLIFVPRDCNRLPIAWWPMRYLVLPLVYGPRPFLIGFLVLLRPRRSWTSPLFQINVKFLFL